MGKSFVTQVIIAFLRWQWRVLGRTFLIWQVIIAFLRECFGSLFSKAGTRHQTIKLNLNAMEMK